MHGIEIQFVESSYVWYGIGPMDQTKFKHFVDGMQPDSFVDVRLLTWKRSNQKQIELVLDESQISEQRVKRSYTRRGDK